MEHITRCEEEVILSIFRLGENASLQTVMDEVNKKYEHEWRPQTVSTFLGRLVRKGYLSMERSGRKVYYIPEISLEQYCRECISERCRVLFEGDMEEFVQCAEKSKDSCHWKRGGRV